MPEQNAVAAITAAITKLVGEPIHEGAGWLADLIREYRLRRVARFVDEYEQIRLRLKIFGFKPVPLKLAIPILNAASIEDDDYLATRYACLLANLTDPDFRGELSPAFHQLLASMSPLDLNLLTEAYKIAVETAPSYSYATTVHRRAQFWVPAEDLFKRTGLDQQVVLPNLDNLQRLRCLVPNDINYDAKADLQGLVKLNYRFVYTSFHVTPLGEQLLLACDPAQRPPTP